MHRPGPDGCPPPQPHTLAIPAHQTGARQAGACNIGSTCSRLRPHIPYMVPLLCCHAAAAAPPSQPPVPAALPACYHEGAQRTDRSLSAPQMAPNQNIASPLTGQQLRNAHSTSAPQPGAPNHSQHCWIQITASNNDQTWTHRPPLQPHKGQQPMSPSSNQPMPSRQSQSSMVVVEHRMPPCCSAHRTRRAANATTSQAPTVRPEPACPAPSSRSRKFEL
mmetsp:Transcript_32759/g.83114  ORF Transcript_32759/g.83114 Transcript_32759/m.83114 type:complete len:220 (-) Transcript_32759:78-737(-)